MRLAENADTPADSPINEPVFSPAFPSTLSAAPSTDSAAIDTSQFCRIPIPDQLIDCGITEIIAFHTPMLTRFRNITSREGLLLKGTAGWGECSPFWDYDDRVSSRWLRAGIEVATLALPKPIRTQIATNVTVPVVSPESARTLVMAQRCHTAKIKVAGQGTTVNSDCDRIAAVREALEELFNTGLITQPGKIRIDANASWTVDEATDAITRYDHVANGLDYVEQPCRSITDMARLRRSIRPRIAADEAIRLASDPLAVVRAEAADVAILKLQPLGGAHAICALAQQLELPVVLSSALDTAVGIHAAATVAAALPNLYGACGLGTVSLLKNDVCAPRFEPTYGVLQVAGDSDRPRLSWAQWDNLDGETTDTSVAITATDLKANSKSKADSDLCARWTKRLEAMTSYV